MKNQQTEGATSLITDNPNNTPDVYPTLPTVEAASVVVWSLVHPSRPVVGTLALTLDPSELAEEGARQSAIWWAETSEEERAAEWPDQEGPPDCFGGCAPLRLEGPPEVVAGALADLSGIDPSGRLSELGIMVSPKRRPSPPQPEEVSGKAERAAAPPPADPAEVERGAAIGRAILAVWPLSASELRALTGILQVLARWPSDDRAAFLTSTAAALRVSG